MSGIAYRERSKTTHIIVHPALTRPSEPKPQEVIRWRDRRAGMLDIGHHVIIDRDGTAHFIRPPKAMGCHTPGFNHCSLSIAMLGGITEDGDFEDNFTAEQKETLMFIVGAALKDWPEAKLVHRREVQRRKGDQEGLPFEMPAISAAPTPWNKLTEMVVVKPPRALSSTKERLRNVKSQTGDNAASPARVGLPASAAKPNPDDSHDEPGDRVPDGTSGGASA